MIQKGIVVPLIAISIGVFIVVITTVVTFKPYSQFISKDLKNVSMENAATQSTAPEASSPSSVSPSINPTQAPTPTPAIQPLDITDMSTWKIYIEPRYKLIVKYPPNWRAYIGSNNISTIEESSGKNRIRIIGSTFTAFCPVFPYQPYDDDLKNLQVGETLTRDSTNSTANSNVICTAKKLGSGKTPGGTNDYIVAFVIILANNSPMHQYYVAMANQPMGIKGIELVLEYADEKGIAVLFKMASSMSL